MASPANHLADGNTRSLFVALVLFLLGSIVSSTSAVPCIEHSEYCHWVGYHEPANRFTDVDVIGDIAYCADYSAGMRILDVSDPEEPLLLADLNLGSTAYSITVEGSVAYVGCSGGMMILVDVTDPESPSVLGFYDHETGGTCDDIALDGSYAFMTVNAVGLIIVDVSDPSNPTFVGSAGIAYPKGVTVRESYAYVASADPEGLLIVDVSDPANPNLVGAGFTAEPCYGVRVSGDYAYVSYGNIAIDLGGLYIMDVSTPGTPALVGNTFSHNPALGLDIVGDVVYLCHREAGLKLINVSNPVMPQVLGHLDTWESARNVVLSGDYAYVADLFGGLQIFYVGSNQMPPVLGGSTTWRALDVAPVGELACVAVQDSGLKIFDCSNPSYLLPRGFVETPGSALGVAAWGNHAYLGDGSAGLQVIDISDPDTPHIVGDWDGDSVGRLIVDESRPGYVFAASNGGLRVFDVSDATDPLLIGTGPGSFADVAVKGDLAFAAEAFGLRVWDISDLTNPLEIGFALCIDCSFAVGICVFDGFAVMACTLEGSWHVFDVSDPTSPTLEASFPVMGDVASDVASAGDILYVAEYEMGMLIYDFSNPLNPSILGNVNIWDEARGVAVSEGYAFMAGDSLGLYATPPQCQPSSSVIEPLPAIGAVSLLSPYPNPSVGDVSLRFSLRTGSSVGVTILDASGRQVRHMEKGWVAPGSHRLVWPGDDDQGRPVASGLYFVRLIRDDGSATRRVILLR